MTPILQFMGASGGQGGSHGCIADRWHQGLRGKLCCQHVAWGVQAAAPARHLMGTFWGDNLLMGAYLMGAGNSPDCAI